MILLHTDICICRLSENLILHQSFESILLTSLGCESETKDILSNTFLKSPLYKGSQIWDTLTENTQRSHTLLQFVKAIKRKYAVFENLLDM